LQEGSFLRTEAFAVSFEAGEQPASRMNEKIKADRISLLYRLKNSLVFVIEITLIHQY